MATRRFLEKGNSIVLPSDQHPERPESSEAASANADSQAGVRPARSPRTAIGGMAAFMREESVAVGELEALKAEHARFEGALPTRALDPKTVRRSRWANRHTSSFGTKDFADLRDEIRNAGGNNQPIKVRPVSPQELTASESALIPKIEFEIVYGHRRHAACLELGLPVSAVIQSRTDRELFEDMERENRERADLSPYEQGAMYLHALKEGLYPSMRQLAEALGSDISVVSKACALAGLPLAVIEAFPSPVEIQFRWAKPLNDAQQKDPDLLLARARSLRAKQGDLIASQVFEALVDKEEGASSGLSPIGLEGAGGKALISFDKKGRMTIKFDRALSSLARVEIERAVKGVLGK